MEKNIYHKSFRASDGQEHRISFHSYRLDPTEANFVINHPKGRLINLIPYPANYEDKPSYYEITFGMNSHDANTQEKIISTLAEIMEEYKIKIKIYA